MDDDRSVGGQPPGSCEQLFLRLADIGQPKRSGVIQPAPQDGRLARRQLPQNSGEKALIGTR